MAKAAETTELQNFRDKLIQLKQEVSQRVDNIERDIRHESTSEKWNERKSKEERYDLLKSLGISAEQELELIKLALIRIDIGEYLYCRSCGEKIPRARLELVPYSSLCTSCTNLLDQ